MNQFEIICFDKMTFPNHPYRRPKVYESVDFKKVDSLLKKIKDDNPHEGYGLTVKIFLMS